MLQLPNVANVVCKTTREARKCECYVTDVHGYQWEVINYY